MDIIDERRALMSIFYGKKEEELNRFEQKFYNLYNTSDPKVANILFNNKKEDPDYKVIDRKNSNTNYETVFCFNERNIKAENLEIKHLKKNKEVYEGEYTDIITLDNLYTSDKLEEISVYERYNNKHIIVMFASFDTEEKKFKDGKEYIKKQEKYSQY